MLGGCRQPGVPTPVGKGGSPGGSVLCRGLCVWGAASARPPGGLVPAPVRGLATGDPPTPRQCRLGPQQDGGLLSGSVVGVTGGCGEMLRGDSGSFLLLDLVSSGNPIPGRGWDPAVAGQPATQRCLCCGPWWGRGEGLRSAVQSVLGHVLKKRQGHPRARSARASSPACPGAVL